MGDRSWGAGLASASCSPSHHSWVLAQSCGRSGIFPLPSLVPRQRPGLGAAAAARECPLCPQAGVRGAAPQEHVRRRAERDLHRERNPGAPDTAGNAALWVSRDRRDHRHHRDHPPGLPGSHRDHWGHTGISLGSHWDYHGHWDHTGIIGITGITPRSLGSHQGHTGITRISPGSLGLLGSHQDHTGITGVTPGSLESPRSHQDCPGAPAWAGAQRDMECQERLQAGREEF